MMRRALIVFIIVTNQVIAQQKKFSVFSIGLQTSATSSMTPNLAFGLSLNYQINKHLLSGGFDIYSPSYQTKSQNIPGYQLGYCYFLRNPDKIVNPFFNFNLLYVQYASGTIWPVRYNYFPNSLEHEGANLWQTKSLVNTLGVGINFKMCNGIRPFLIVGGGYNYFQTKNSQKNFPVLYADHANTGILPSIHFKLGFILHLNKSEIKS